MDTDLTQTFELVRRAQDGERASMDRLCTRYYPRVLRIVRARITPELRQMLASEDVAQAVFIKALRQFDRFEFRDDASLVNWLARIAQCEIHDHRDFYLAKQRDVRRQQRIQTSPGSGTQGGPIDPATRPLDGAIRQERQAHLTEAVAALPEVQRELIVLRDFCGYTWQAVADHLERPSADSARMAHAQAIVALQIELKQRGVSE